MQPANNGQPAAKGKKLRQVYATEQVAHLWANGVNRYICNSAATASTSPDGRVLYSYAQAIAARTDVRDAAGRKVYLFNSNARQSTTTQKHVSNARRAVPFQVSCASLDNDGWDGRRETIADATCHYYIAGSDKAPTTEQVLTFSVRDVHAADGPAHASNYRDLFRRAEADAREMGKRRSRFFPSHVAQVFRAAAEYRATFCADHAADLAASFDWEALAASFTKARARRDKAEAASKARSADFKRAEAAWMAAVAPTLTDLAAYLRSAPDTARDSLRAAVAVYEASGNWDHESATPSRAQTQVRAVIDALLKEGAHGFFDVAERVGLNVLPAFSLPVDGAIRPPCRALVRAYPRPPTRLVFGREVADDYRNLRQVYDAVGVSRYDVNYAYGASAARLATGRDLLHVRQDGDEVITSGGARVPLGIISALWRRHGAEVREAALAPYSLTFPEARRVGAFSWIGYAVSVGQTSATDGGASVLLIGCHLVAAADVARLARRLGWPEPEAA